MLRDVRAAELREHDHESDLGREFRRGRLKEREDAGEAPTPLGMLCVRPHLLEHGEEDVVRVPREEQLKEGEGHFEREDGGVVAENVFPAIADVTPVCLGVYEGIEGNQLDAVALERERIGEVDVVCAQRREGRLRFGKL